MFRITILTENNAGAGFCAEHGLSYLIEYDSQSILFDTGASDVFIQNAEKLGINLHETVSTIVLSHGHWDHGNGLQYMHNKTLITHPSSCIKRYRKNDMSYIGIQHSHEELESIFDLQCTTAPYAITDSIFFLGEIPRNTTFESRTTTFVDEHNNPDFVPDDSALAIIYNNQLIIVSGCAHAGICNTIEYAKHVTGIQSIFAVLGGFHLKHANEQTKKTVEYLSKQNITHLYPSHCTELPALSVIYNALHSGALKTGMVLSW